MKLTLVFCGLLCAVTAIPGTPSTDPSAYDLRYRIPSGCDPTTNCTYFVGLEVNANDSSFLDVFLTAPVAGWVAVGFSPTPSMPDSNVFGCIVRDSEVEVIDTYNVPTGPNNNVLDPEQGDIVSSSGELANGRITCTFSRLIAGDENPSIDRNLNNSFFLLSGFNSNGRDTANTGFSVHGFMRTPPRTLPRALSTEMVNPVMAEGELPLMEPTARPTDVPAPVIEPQDYRLRRRDPAGCNPRNCDYFMGINNNSNPEYLDFYMTADIGGWVAVGFSRSANMFDADVVGCNVDPINNDVVVVDTSNPVSGRANNLDITQDVIQHSSSFENGRITCIFSRKIIGSDDAPMDRPLNADYYFLFGVGRSGGGSGGFPNHLPLIPPVSGSRVNPLEDSGDIGVSRLRQQLLQAHGILMLIAWPLLAFTAIFFAAWMKQALPNGEWFQVHRAFHIAALFVAVIGFILAFVANMDTAGLITLGSVNKSGTTHFVLGIVIMALQIANPIISIFRCKPTGDYRWIFNIIHGVIIGLGVELLAYVNIGIGVSIFSETQSEFGDLTIFWVYLAFAIFGVVLNTGLLLFFTFEACFKGQEGTKLAPAVTKPFFNKVYGSGDTNPPQGVELKTPGEPEKPAGPPPRKPPSKDAPIRWLALGLFLGIMVPLILAVIIMIAATGSLDE
jgi:hypothetical protein